MNMILLTKSAVPVIGYVAELLGFLMDGIYRCTKFFDVGGIAISNIGLCIIIFTIVINLLMFPLTLKQQKSSKLMSVMQPEIQAIQKKYKGKTDNESMMRMQTETKAVYDKYGTSMTGGCVQMAISMVVLFALYQVIYRIPAYVTSVRVFYDNVATPLMQQAGYTEVLADMIKAAKVSTDNMATQNGVVDFLYKLNPTQWKTLAETFPSMSAVISDNASVIERLNNFFGLNMSNTPWQGFMPNVAWIIPILAGATQWYSTKLMTVNQPSAEDNPMAAQMKSMNMMMPLVSVFFCFTFPIGIGIYWIASAVCRIIQQVAINAHLNSIDMDEMIKKNVEKANAKRAKKGLPPQTVSKNTLQNAKNMDSNKTDEAHEMEVKKERAARQAADSSAYYNRNAKPGSIAAKANMVAMYDEKKAGKKTNTEKKSEDSTTDDDK